MPTTALLDEKRLESLIAQWTKDGGRQIQKRRKLLGWNQGQLADLTGVRTSSISKFELGQALPKESVRLAIACALCCEVGDIWPALDRNQVMNVARTVQVAA
jgi:transcriptional regulator with XRE-family HTH domain